MKPTSFATEEHAATFEKVMAENSLPCSTPLIPDGRIHRYEVPGDKPKSLNGWYVLYDGQNPTIVFGSWKTDQKLTWSVKNPDEFSPHEQQQRQTRIAEAQEQAKQERGRLHQDAAIRAQRIWEQANPALADHPYLLKKWIQPYGIRVSQGKLVLPVYGENGIIATLQFIGEDGEKRFLTHGAKAGNYFAIGEPGDLFYLVEGYATGATVHELTGACTVMAFDAGNLRPVAERLKREHPHATIIIAADNDHATEGNPGLTKAKAAAEAVGGSVVYPTFTQSSSNGKPPTDFNDLFRLEGKEAVRTQLKVLHQTEEWPDLISLETHQLPEIPDNLFPKWMEDMIGGVARATETPKELAAGLGLASLSTACQRVFEVEPEAGYTEPVNVYVNAAMDSGNRKTAVLNAMTEPLTNYEREEAAKVAPDIKRLGSERRSTEARIDHLRRQAARAKEKDAFDQQTREVAELEASLPKVPALPQVWAQDVTPEKLATVMEEHGGVLSILSDEGGVFENLAGRYNRGIPNLDLILKAHSGSPVRIHRASRDCVDMRAPALTMGLSPQPEILQGLVQKPGFRGCGLLARFLYVIPVSRLGFRSLESKPVPEPVKKQYEHSLQKLLAINPPTKEDGSPGRYKLKLSHEAHKEWKEFSRVVEHDMRDGERFEYMRDWAGKLPGAAVRVAGLLHCAKYAEGKPWEHAIDLSTMEKTLTLMAILAEHAIQAFEVMAANPDIEKAKKVLNWIQRNGADTFTMRACHRDLEGTFKRVEDLKPGLDVLTERAFIRQATKQERRSGRPSYTFEVNPQVLGRRVL